MSYYPYKKYTLQQYGKLLAEEIDALIEADFKEHHLTGNLVKTKKIIDDGKGMVQIAIPAIKYDQWKYLNEGVFVSTPEKGSYANILDRQGGKVLRRKTNYHKKYIENSIDDGIRNWKKKYHVKTERIKIKNG